MKPTRNHGCGRWFFGGVLPAVLLAGCAVGPNYVRPAVEAPRTFRFAEGESTNSLGDLPWWDVFKDPVLLNLIGTAVTNNHDLRQAMSRVEQARNVAVATRASLFPQVGYGAEIGHGRNAAFNSPVPRNGATDSSGVVGLNALWEIDLWGRIRRLSEGARAEYLSTAEARRGLLTTLVSDVAVTYFQLIQFDEELEIQRAATNAYASSLQLFRDRLSNGVASKLETERAAAALANAAASIPRLELSIAIAENQLSVLLGRNPGPVFRESVWQHGQVTPEIPVGLPSGLLRRRPDIAGSEQRLIAANAELGASLADYFPRIGLTTLVGKVSPELSALTGGSANLWNVGASIAGPLFQGGRLGAQYRASKAKVEEADAAYRQSILVALREVSDSLITRAKLAEARIYHEQAAVALVSSVELASQRYRGGRSSYFEVLQAQQELYPTQRAVVQAKLGELMAMVQLYRSLGGGWEEASIEIETSGNSRRPN